MHMVNSNSSSWQVVHWVVHSTLMSMLGHTRLFYNHTSRQAIYLSYRAISLVVLRSVLWGTKLSSTIMFFLCSSPKAIRKLLITPSHLAIP